MKQLLFVLTFIISAGMNAQQETPKGAWLEKWENSKKYLIAVADSMPEANYSFKPTERQMTFKEQLIHIKGNIDWLSNTYFTEDGFERTEMELPKTKTETISLITEAFDNAKAIIEKTPETDLAATVKFFAGPKSKFQILNLLQDHVTHHRGQLLVYLNLNDVEPPKFIGW